VETIQYRSDDRLGVAEACLGHLNGEGPMVPLEELFSATWAQHDESKKVAWYRNTARTLLDYFLVAEQGLLRGKLAVLMSKLSRGHDTRAVLGQVFPDMTVAELETKMKNFRKDSEVRPRGLCPVKYPIPPSRMADFTSRTEPVSKDDMERLFKRVWALPRRQGYVDWYPPEMLTLAGVFKP
jgi:hypothetical protein